MSMFEGNAMAQFGASFDASDFDSGTKSATNSLLALGSATKKTMGAFTVLAGAFGFATLEAIKFHEQMTTLRRLAGEDIAAKLGEDILKLSEQLPASRQELIGIAEEAVRLGVEGRSNIRSFTTAVAQLSGATQLNATQAANSIAKIARVTDASIEDTRRLSSVINELSKNYGTSAQEIVKATGKLAPTARLMGFTAEQTLGIAAALNEVNISVRRGATRLRRFFQQSLNPGKQREIANAIELTSEEFRSMIATSEGAEEILQRVVSAMAAGGESAEILRTTLSSASRQGVSVLAGQLERLPEAIDTAESAFADGTSALREQATQLDTTSEQWDIFAENFKQTAMGLGDEGFVRAILGAMNLENQIFQLRHEGTELERVLGGMTEDLKFMKDEAGLTSTEVFALSTSAQQLKDEIQGQERRELFISQFMEILRENNFQIGQSIRAMGRWQTALSDIDGTIERFINQDYIRQGIMNRVMYGEDGMLPRMDPVRLAREELDSLIDDFGKWRNATGEQRGALEELFSVATSQFSSNELQTFVSRVQQMFGMGLDPEALLPNIRAMLRNMGADLSGLGAEADNAADSTDRLIRRLREQKHELESGRLASVRQTEAWENATETERRLIESLVRHNEEAELLKEAQDRVTSAVEDAIGMDIPEEMDAISDSTARAASEWENLANQIKNGKEQAGKIVALVEKKGLAGQGSGDDSFMSGLFPDEDDMEGVNFDETEDDINDLQETIDELSFATVESQMRFLEDTVKDVSQAFSDAFLSMMDDSKDFEESLTSLLETLGGDLLQRGLQLSMMQLLTNPKDQSALFGLIDFGSRQHGGPVTPGRAYEVGESGRELFVPNVSGTIIPNSQLGGSSSNGKGGVNVQVVQEFNMSAIDERGMSELIEQNRARIGKAAVEAVEGSEVATRKVNARRSRRR